MSEQNKFIHQHLTITMKTSNLGTSRLLQSFFKKQNWQYWICQITKRPRTSHFTKRLVLCWKSILVEVGNERQACVFWWSVLLLRISLVHQDVPGNREWDVKRTKVGKPRQPVMRHTTSVEKALTAIYLRPKQPKADLCDKELNHAKTLVKLNSAWMASHSKEFREENTGV